MHLFKSSASLYKDSGLKYVTAFYVTEKNIIRQATTLVQFTEPFRFRELLCESIYRPFYNAAKNNQIEYALLYMTPEVRNKYRTVFKAMVSAGVDIAEAWPSPEELCAYTDFYKEQHQVYIWYDNDIFLTISMDDNGIWRISII